MEIARLLNRFRAKVMDAEFNPSLPICVKTFAGAWVPDTSILAKKSDGVLCKSKHTPRLRYPTKLLNQKELAYCTP